MTDQQVVSQESESLEGRKVFLLISIVAAGLTLCTVMMSIVCDKCGDSCPCQTSSYLAGNGCFTSEKE